MTAGESHAKCMVTIVDGVPPQLKLTEADIQPQLTRRRPGQSRLTTPRDEKDKVIGKHHSVFVSYEYSKSDEYAKFWESLRKGKYFDGIFERRKVDGSTVYLQASYNPVMDSKGNITDVVKIATAIPIIPSVFPNLDVLGEESPLREKINNTAENKYNNEAMI